MKHELHFSQMEADGKIHYYAIIPTSNGHEYELYEEDCYWLNRVRLGSFNKKSEAKKYIAEYVNS